MANPLPLSLIEQTLQRPLTSLERLILEGSWQGQRYRQLADEAGYVENYVKQIGSQLWAELSEKKGVAVTKKNLHLVFDQFPMSVESNSHVVPLSQGETVPQIMQGRAVPWGAVQSPLRSPTLSLAFPSGPLSLDSPLYIARPPLESAAFGEIVRPGGLLCIKAPRQ